MPTNETTRRAALYARVSQARHESRSVPEQLDELHAWALRDGWQVVAEKSDEVSASRYSRKARPGWQEVMELINTGQVDTLALWEISRAARDRPVHAALLAACVENGVWVGVNGRLHDPNDPDDGFMLDLGGALAVRESSMTSKRTRRDVKERAVLGRPHGSLPYGYKRVIDPETGKTVGRVKHPEQALVVAEIARRLLAREPADAIAKDLNRREITTATGKQWRGGNLSLLIQHPVYAALRVHQGRVLEGVKGTWPEIISEADHHRLVALFSSPDRDRYRNSTHVKHLGSGLFRCGREGCDGRMKVVAQSGHRPVSYCCRLCFKVSRRQAPVDEAVEKLVIARLSQPDALAALADVDDSVVREAAEEIARLEGKLAEARKAWEDDELTLAEYKDLRERIRPKIEAAQLRARPRNVPAAVFEIAGPEAESKWGAASIGDRRAVLDALLEVTIKPLNRRGGSNGRKPAPFDPAESLSVRWKTG